MFEKLKAIPVWLLAGVLTLGVLFVPESVPVVGPLVQAATAAPTVGPVVFPVDPEEIGDSIANAGANILVIVFTVSIGFTLVYMVIRRLKKAI